MSFYASPKIRALFQILAIIGGTISIILGILTYQNPTLINTTLLLLITIGIITIISNSLFLIMR